MLLLKLHCHSIMAGLAHNSEYPAHDLLGPTLPYVTLPSDTVKLSLLDWTA